MDSRRLCVLGMGSVRCAPAIIGALASYFGERPLEIRFYDSDAERLDLFDRFARVCFRLNKNGHHLLSTESTTEAIEGVGLLIVAVGGNCARKYLKTQRRQGFALDEHPVEQAVEAMMEMIGDGVEVLSLLGDEIPIPLPSYASIDWPPKLSLAQRSSIPHQILRCLNGEDFPFHLLSEGETSPIRTWLNDPASTPHVAGKRL